MTKVNVSLDMDQVSELVRQSLIQDYELNKDPDFIDCSDWEIDPDLQLLKALVTAINYYSTPEQFAEWKKGITNER